MSILSAIIDSREPEWCKGLKLDGCPVEVSLLDAGDLIAVGSDGVVIAVERKTGSDLLNTLRDERLFPQLAKLREITPYAYLLICGSLMAASGGKCFVNGAETGWSWASVQGALLSIQELGIGVISVASDADYESAIIRLVNRDRGTIRVTPPRDITVVDDATAILASLPGIGVDRAGKLLDYCGSVSAALWFLTDPSFEGSLAGFGAAIKQRVRSALGLSAAEILTVIDQNGSPVLKEKAS